MSHAQITNTAYLRDHALTRGFMLGRPSRPKPTPDGRSVLFLRSEPRVPKLLLYEFDVATKTTKLLLSPEQLLKGADENLSPEEKARRERMRVSVGGFTNYELTRDGARILVSLSGKLYVFDRASAQVQELKTGAGTILDPRFSPDGKFVSYVRDNDIYVIDLTENSSPNSNPTERRLTTGGTDRLSHGLAEFVAQEEMNRFQGYWWSPDSKQILFQETDASNVETWFVADPIKPEQSPLPSFYPRPGKSNVTVRLALVSVAAATPPFGVPASAGSPSTTATTPTHLAKMGQHQLSLPHQSNVGRKRPPLPHHPKPRTNRTRPPRHRPRHQPDPHPRRRNRQNLGQPRPKHAPLAARRLRVPLDLRTRRRLATRTPQRRRRTHPRHRPAQPSLSRLRRSRSHRAQSHLLRQHESN